MEGDRETGKRVEHRDGDGVTAEDLLAELMETGDVTDLLGDPEPEVGDFEEPTVADG